MKSFPFWKYSLGSPESMMETLKNQQLNITNVNNDKVLIRTYPDDYLKCDHISSHFTEYERIKCHFADKPSPLEVWKDMIKKNKDIFQLDNSSQREIIYNVSKGCNTFNVTFCLWILNELVGSNAKILDPSSGWGDRLIAAIASNASIYHGTDPNIRLQKGYNDIKKAFLKKEHMQRFTVKKLPFEDMTVINNYYDIALTSPPYYDLEKYSDSKTQSINRHPRYEDWLLFYQAYLHKMATSVKSGGYVVVYIEDIFSKGVSYKIREFTMSVMSDPSCNVKYYSKFGLKIGKNIRWALVWKKK